MLVWTVEFLCWLILVRPHILCCWLSWPLTIVTQSGGIELTYIMMVAIRNLLVAYGHSSVKQWYETVLHSVVKVTIGLWVPLAIPFVAIRIMWILASVMVGTLAVTLGWINLLNPTGHVMHQQFNIQQLYALPTLYLRVLYFSAHTVFMCFVFIWEQTATCASYKINWLVFITEKKSVYCAVRTGSFK